MQAKNECRGIKARVVSMAVLGTLRTPGRRLQRKRLPASVSRGFPWKWLPLSLGTLRSGPRAKCMVCVASAHGAVEGPVEKIRIGSRQVVAAAKEFLESEPAMRL